MKVVFAGASLAIALAAFPSIAQNVKITPLGSHAGELCAVNGVTPHLAISGSTMEFDGRGKCVAGC